MLAILPRPLPSSAKVVAGIARSLGRPLTAQISSSLRARPHCVASSSRGAANSQERSMNFGSSGGGGQEDGRAAGNNPIGAVIKSVYGVGGPTTIKWGLLKTKVDVPEGAGDWESWRRSTEKDREALRKHFADKLEVISYPERSRRAQTLTAVAAVAAVSGGAPAGLRLAFALPLFLGIGYVDSSIQGLCTESLAGAWDVDDSGLEYMPRKELAQRIQAKVAKLYLRDGAVAAAITALICSL